jgi:hypothetical protein
MDLISEITIAHIKVLLKCAFGIDLSQEILIWEENGKAEEKHLDFIMIESFHSLFFRALSP